MSGSGRVQSAAVRTQKLFPKFLLLFLTALCFCILVRCDWLMLTMEDHAHPLAAVNETCAGSVWEAPFTPPILTDDLGIEGVDSKVLPALYQLAVQVRLAPAHRQGRRQAPPPPLALTIHPPLCRACGGRWQTSAARPPPPTQPLRCRSLPTACWR